MNTPFHFVHVEDSPEDAELVRLALREAPFTYSAVRVDREAAFRSALDERMPDAILCDYDMPFFSAERALEILHERDLDIPFIVVSAHIGESAAVIAMQNGASDYISKRDMRRLPKAVEVAIDRCHARREKVRVQAALASSEAMKRSILNSLASRIAVVDGEGIIRAVNEPWREFAAVRSESGFGTAELGDNYLASLEAAGEAGNPFAREGAVGIRDVIARKHHFASMEYQIGTGPNTRWYLARATPLEGTEHGAVVSHTDITDRMMAHVALESAHKRLQNLSKRVLSIQEEERRTIAGELHDDIGQTLAALKIGLHRLVVEPSADRAKLQEQCLLAADETLDRLRRIVLELRPPQLDQLGLADAVGWLAERQRDTSGLEIETDFTGLGGKRLPPLLEVACYRIIQEGLNNATRHAKAAKVRIQAESDQQLLKLTIHDNGVGFDEEAARQKAMRSGSLGLVSMEERAKLAGGRLKVRTVVGRGTTLSVLIPLRSGDIEATVEEGANP